METKNRAKRVSQSRLTVEGTELIWPRGQRQSCQFSCALSFFLLPLRLCSYEPRRNGELLTCNYLNQSTLTTTTMAPSQHCHGLRTTALTVVILIAHYLPLGNPVLCRSGCSLEMHLIRHDNQSKRKMTWFVSGLSLRHAMKCVCSY